MNEKQIDEIKIKLKTAFKELKFDYKTHTYTISGERFPSVSACLKDFSKEFNSYQMAELVAQKYNKENPDKPPRNSLWYLKHWKIKNEEATAKGSRVHYYAEQYPNLDKPSCNQEEGVKEWFEQLDSKYIVIFMELQMYCKKIKIAGTTDLVLLNTETGNIVLADWKTNSVSLLQVYNKTKLKKPFNKFYDNSYHKYVNQLSYYQILLENNTDLIVEERWLIWLVGDEYQELPEDKNANKYHIEKINADLIGKNFKMFKCEDRTEAIKKYIETKRKKELKPKSSTKVKTKSLFSSKMLKNKKTDENALKALKQKLKSKSNDK